MGEISEDRPAVAQLRGQPSHCVLCEGPPLRGPGKSQITEGLACLSLQCETLFSKPWRTNESVEAKDSMVSDLWLKNFPGAAVQKLDLVEKDSRQGDQLCDS